MWRPQILSYVLCSESAKIWLVPFDLTYSQHNALLFTRTLLALVKSSALWRKIMPFWDTDCVYNLYPHHCAPWQNIPHHQHMNTLQHCDTLLHDTWEWYDVRCSPMSCVSSSVGVVVYSHIGASWLNHQHMYCTHSNFTQGSSREFVVINIHVYLSHLQWRLHYKWALDEILLIWHSRDRTVTDEK
jgi:hypothetical protein